MKKFASVLIICACLLTMLVPISLPAGAENTADTGTDENTVIISNAEELLQFAQNIADGKGVEVYGGKTVSITADIDLNSGWDAASGEAPSVTWPIASDKFVQSLVIEGNNHTISGLYALCPDVTSGATQYGLFGNAAEGGSGVVVQNLSITNSKMVLPYLKSGFIKCGGLFGGVVGGNVTLNHLYVDIDIAPTVHETDGSEDVCSVGGLIGWVRQRNNTNLPEAKVSISNCVVVSDINPGDIWAVGGYLGRSENNSIIEITDSAFYGRLTGRHSVGGFLGRMNAASYTLTRCVFGGNIDGNPGSSGGLVVSIQGGTTPTYTFTDCIITKGYETMPSGCPTNGYTVVKYTDLINVPEGWDAYGWRQPVQSALITSNSIATPIVLHTRFYGYQVSDASDGVFDIRLIAVVDSLAYSAVGFDVTAVSGSLTSDLTYNQPITTVYESLIAYDETGDQATYTAEELGGNYIFALNITNIPVDMEAITFTVFTYSVQNGDTDAQQSITFTVNPAELLSE